MPTVDVGKFGVYWVLSHTIRLAPGGVGGDPHLAILRKAGGTWISEELSEMQEASQYVDELERHIGNFALNTVEEATAESPPQPPA